MKQEVIIDKKGTNNIKCEIKFGKLNEYLFANQKPQKPSAVVQKVKEQTLEILCKCVKPIYKVDDKISETGLVFGYVQSGKTLSFTSLISLAADNKYRLIVVLAGRSVILLDQTYDRLKSDLGTKDNKDEYLFEKNPTLDFKTELVSALEDDETTIVLTLLKHQLYLDNLAKLLSDAKINKLIKKLGVLIIDDESDQAGLSTKAYENATKEDGEVDKFSAIYSGIKYLRSTLNYHSYIQYTATPQANLLIDYLDILSPKWHVVLEPGAAYTGGRQFFIEQTQSVAPKFKYSIKLAKKGNYTKVFSDPKTDIDIYFPKLIRQIPENEKYHPTRLPLESIPGSLVECLKSFFLQSIILTRLKDDPLSFSSMVIHLHVYKSAHAKVEGWMKQQIDRWKKDIDLAYLKKDFEKTFLDDEVVAKSGFSFNEVYSYLAKHLSRYKLHQISGKTKPKIDWDESRVHILIGGMKLDRGFTVENLTHTYMPRHTIGTDNADTIQQRCRFFGYKKGYLSSCRVYLPFDLICKYSDYVSDEEELRNFLITHPDINDFFDPKHALALAPRLRPTRQNILSNKLVSNYFIKYKYFNPLLPTNFVENVKITDDFVKKIKKKKLIIDYKSPGRKHDLYKVDIDFFEKELLNKLKIDSFIDVLVRKKISRYLPYLKTKSVKCWIMNMGQGAERVRSIKKKNVPNEGKNAFIYKIENPFSGRGGSWPDEKDILNSDPYKQKYSYDDELIIQIHKIIAKCPENADINGKTLSTICIYFSPKHSIRYIALYKADV